jgi:hypothetical protein
MKNPEPKKASGNADKPGRDVGTRKIELRITTRHREHGNQSQKEKRAKHRLKLEEQHKRPQL